MQNTIGALPATADLCRHSAPFRSSSSCPPALRLQQAVHARTHAPPLPAWCWYTTCASCSPSPVCTRCMRAAGQGLPAMMPVRRDDRSRPEKLRAGGCSAWFMCANAAFHIIVLSSRVAAARPPAARPRHWGMHIRSLQRRTVHTQRRQLQRIQPTPQLTLDAPVQPQTLWGRRTGRCSARPRPPPRWRPRRSSLRQMCRQGGQGREGRKEGRTAEGLPMPRAALEGGDFWQACKCV